MEAFLEKRRPVVGHDAVSTPIRSRLATDEPRSSRTTRTPCARSPTRCGRCTTRCSPGAARSTSSGTVARGKMMVRERLEALVDPGTPGARAVPAGRPAHRRPGRRRRRGGAGRGRAHPVPGHRATTRPCAAARRAPPRSASSCAPWTWRRRTASRCLILVESGGADLPRQADVFVPGGEQFRRLTQLSAQGIPTICVVFGSSTAGGAYLPGMSDYTVMVEDRARVFLGGPPLVKMAIGEEADEEELGGALMHARTSGLCDYLARDEPDALRIARGIVAHLHWRRLGPGPAAAGRRAALPGRGAAGHRLGRRARALRRARDPRPRPRRLPLRGVQGRSTAPQLVCGWGVHRRLPGRRRGQQRHPVLAPRRRRAPSSSRCATGPTPRSCSCRTSPASWSARATSRAGSSRTAPS